MNEITIKLNKDQAYELEKILDYQRGLLVKTFIQILDSLKKKELSKDEKELLVKTNESLLKLQFGTLEPIVEQLELARKQK